MKVPDLKPLTQPEPPLKVFRLRKNTRKLHNIKSKTMKLETDRVKLRNSKSLNNKKDFLSMKEEAYHK